MPALMSRRSAVAAGERQMVSKSNPLCRRFPRGRALVQHPHTSPLGAMWAEAMAARESMLTLENELKGHEYKMVDRVVDKGGKVSARFISEGQYDISDTMKVYTAGAAVDGKWDWCGKTVKLTPGSQKPTAAPNLWWPSGDVYDPRAAD